MHDGNGDVGVAEVCLANSATRQGDGVAFQAGGPGRVDEVGVDDGPLGVGIDADDAYMGPAMEATLASGLTQ